MKQMFAADVGVEGSTLTHAMSVIACTELEGVIVELLSQQTLWCKTTPSTGVGAVLRYRK